MTALTKKAAYQFVCRRIDNRWRYFLKSLIVFTFFFCIGTPLIGVTGAIIGLPAIGRFYIWPQWSTANALLHFLLTGHFHMGRGFFTQGTIVYALGGALSGILLGRIPQRWHKWALILSLISFQLLYFLLIFTFKQMGIFDAWDD